MKILRTYFNPLVFLQNILQFLLKIAPLAQSVFIALAGLIVYLLISTSFGFDLKKILADSLFASVFSAVLGWAVGYVSSRQQTVQVKRIEGVRQKLEKFYQPLLANTERLASYLSGKLEEIGLDPDVGVPEPVRRDLIFGLVREQIEKLETEIVEYQKKRAELNRQIFLLSLQSIPQGQNAAMASHPGRTNDHYWSFLNRKLHVRIVSAGTNNDEHPYSEQINVAFLKRIEEDEIYLGLKEIEGKLSRRNRRLKDFAEFFNAKALYLLYREVRVL